MINESQCLLTASYLLELSSPVSANKVIWSKESDQWESHVNLPQVPYILLLAGHRHPGLSYFAPETEKWIILLADLCLWFSQFLVWNLGVSVRRKMFCDLVMPPLSAGIHHEGSIDTLNVGCNTNITFFVSARRFQLSPNWSISPRQPGSGRADRSWNLRVIIF